MINFGKVVEAKIFGVTLHNDTTRLALGFYSGATSATVASQPKNPLKGTLLWDQAMFVIQGASVNGGATGGSYTILLETDALKGYTALPIATATLGPNSSATAGIVMDSLHQSPASPLPTHVRITQGSTGRCSFVIHAIAKQYRGTLGTPRANSAERILQGALLNLAGVTISADTTFIIGSTVTDLGMGHMRLWDNALFWCITGSTTTGTWDADVVGKIGGVTTTIASTGIAGTLSAAGDKKALVNNFYGQACNPTQIIITEVSGGATVDLQVVGIAKSGRGSMAKS